MSFNGEYDTYIKSQEWRSKADQRLRIDNYECCICGKPASEVHHLTYVNFKKEQMDDLVSLCGRCHLKAEEIADSNNIPWAMELKEVGTSGKFMAAMRIDASKLVPVVWKYIREVRGDTFPDLMKLRQPEADDVEQKRHWSLLKRIVRALCGKRYFKNCAADRSDIMINGITNHLAVSCIEQIEHDVRNEIQKKFHEYVEDQYKVNKPWKNVASQLGVSKSLVYKMHTDDGSSFGPTLREAVFHYCGMDAADGFAPPEGFSCLTKKDYETLNNFACYVQTVTHQETTSNPEKS